MALIAISTPFDEPDFRAGLEFGLIGAVAFLALGTTWVRSRGAVAPIGGLLLAAATLVGLYVRDDYPAGLGLAIVVLVASGVIGDLLDQNWTLSLLPAAIGGYLLATQTGVPEVLWIQVLVGVTALMGGGLLAAFDRRWTRQPFGPPLFFMSTVGVYYTVPETAAAMVLLGAAIPAALLAWPFRLGRLGVGGSFGAAGLLAWASATGGLGRHSAIVGGVACLGLMVAEPIARTMSEGRSALSRRNPTWLWPTVSVAQLVLVYVGSRVAGLASTPTAAAIVAGIALAGMAATLVWATNALPGGIR